MIFLEYVGSRPLKPKTLGSQIKTSPVKSTFYGTFSIYPVDNRKGIEKEYTNV